VDGVFTDNRNLLMPGIEPVRTFHTRDAYAVQHAVKEGLRIIIISGGKSEGVRESSVVWVSPEIHLGTVDKVAPVRPAGGRRARPCDHGVHGR
jgi:3-deoxy-D-manno-octulosonate 8-phosphate phosphatase (KDO 8-P phosphatase)